MYSKQWTDFETQSLAFGFLRKALFPKYLVRGYSDEIRIYTPTADSTNPDLKLILKVKASPSKDDSLFKLIDPEEGVMTFLLVGGDKAFAVTELLKPYI
jgi:hypothetical protein